MYCMFPLKQIIFRKILHRHWEIGDLLESFSLQPHIAQRQPYKAAYKGAKVRKKVWRKQLA